MKKNIVWLASYPKSGNTWLRMFLANYITGATEPLSINKVQRIGTGDGVASHYRRLSKGSFDPSDDRVVLAMRKRVLETLASNGADVNLLKTHNKNKVIEGVKMIPPGITRRAIYVIRNPLDMLISYAHHYSATHAAAAIQIASPMNSTVPDKTIVRQYLGGWSEHVKSWANCSRFPVTVIRYEDMTDRPIETFSKVLEDIGAPVDPTKVERAVQFSRFDEMQRQETEQGFVERSAFSDRFFRSGKVGEGEKNLDSSVIDKLVADHEPTMRRYGYTS